MRLLASLVIASLFTSGTFDTSAVDRETGDVHGTIQRLAQEVAGLDEDDQMLDTLLGWRDCVGLSVHLGEALEGSGDSDAAKVLYRAAVDGTIRRSAVPAVRNQARLNLAVAHLNLGEQSETAAVAWEVLACGALEPGAQLQAMELLLHAGVDPANVRVLLDEIRSFYHLDEKQTELAALVEQMLSDDAGAAT